MNWMVSSQNSCVEVVTPDVTVLGDRAVNEVIKDN